MSAFAALGLDEDADERAVKRAYAQRLRSTRPDEDPEGFQALNAAYKSALAAIRWRGQAQAIDADAELQTAPEAEALVPPEAPPGGDAATRPSHRPELVFDEPPAEPTPVEVPESLFDYAAPRADGGIEFDFDAFSADLLAVTADPDADLRAWLDARMATWPLAMKPTLAPYMLGALDDEAVAVSPDHLAIIIAAFGLDDVLSGADPLAVEQLRKANQQRWTRHEGGVRGRRLLARENRRELDQRVRVAGYPRLVAPAIAHMLTSPRAARWAALRWFPPIPRTVMKLLRYLSAGAVETLSPPIDPRVLARWQSAERTVGRIKLFYVAAIGVVIYAVVLGSGIMTPGDDADAIALQRVNEIWREEGPTPQKAIDDYTDFINSHPPPRSVFVSEDVSTAMFNKGIVLSKSGRPREAEDAYRVLDDTFADSTEPSIRLRVAQGLNNWAYLLSKRDAYAAVVPIARQVVARYSGAGDEDQGNDSFDVQAGKALIDLADALEHLGDRQGALAACADLLTRFKDTTTEEGKDLKATALAIEADYGVRPVAPAATPFSLQGAPKAPGDPVRPWPPAIGLPK